MVNRIYSSQELKDLQQHLNKMNPVDLAEHFSNLTPYEVAIRIKLLNKDLLADTFAELTKDKKLEIIQILSQDRIQELMQELDEDELVDTLQEMPANMVKQIMTRYIDEDRRPIINQLLGYPEDSVGSIMSVRFISCKMNDPIDNVKQAVLNSDLDADKLEQIWVTDPYLKLIGFIFLADLFRAKEDNLMPLMQSVNRTVSAHDDQEVVAKLALRYDLSQIPVVDRENRLIGTVPVEWAIDVVREEYDEDLSNIHGITDEPDEGYLESSNFAIAKSRTTWLVICLVTATITGFIIHRYESMLAGSVALAAYIPMLMDSGGNAGSQSSTTVIRSLFTGDITLANFFQVMFKEMSIGIYVGVILAVVNFLRILIMDNVPISINLTVSFTLIITVIISKMMGGILPLIAEKLKIDPTVMAGPIITTIVDTVSLLIYFEVASLMLGL